MINIFSLWDIRLVLFNKWKKEDTENFLSINLSKRKDLFEFSKPMKIFYKSIVV